MKCKIKVFFDFLLLPALINLRYKNMNYFIKMQKISVIISFFALIFSIGYLSAQELDPIIDVDMTKLNPDVQDRLSNFKIDVQNYLAKTRFTNEEITNDIRGKPYKIKCNFQFIFNSSSGFDSYDAQLVLTVQRFIYKSPSFTPLIRIKDESWSFNYVRGQSFYHDDLKYNNITSFLDYYAYMIIGVDDDSWEPKLGTERYQKAQNVVNLAVSNSSTAGWYDNNILKASRSTYPSELLNSKYEEFRKAFWIYHFAGLDSIQYNKRTALERISQALETMGKVKKLEVRSFIINAFFDTKYLEIAATLTDYYDKSIYRKLMDIDPDHSSTYQEYSKK